MRYFILALVMVLSVSLKASDCFSGANNFTLSDALEIAQDANTSVSCLKQLEALHWDSTTVNLGIVKYTISDYNCRKQIRDAVKTNLAQREEIRQERITQEKAEAETNRKRIAKEQAEAEAEKQRQANEAIVNKQLGILKDKLGFEYELMAPWVEKVLTNTQNQEGEAKAEALVFDVDKLISMARDLRIENDKKLQQEFIINQEIKENEARQVRIEENEARQVGIEENKSWWRSFWGSIAITLAVVAVGEIAYQGNVNDNRNGWTGQPNH